MEIKKCLNCGKPVKQTEGKRERKFCDNKNACKIAYWNKANPKPKKVGRLILVADENGAWKTIQGVKCRIVWDKSDEKIEKLPYLVKNKHPKPTEAQISTNAPKDKGKVAVQDLTENKAEIELQIKAHEEEIALLPNPNSGIGKKLRESLENKIRALKYPKQ